MIFCLKNESIKKYILNTAFTKIKIQKKKAIQES